MPLLKRWRRRRAASRPFPPVWRRVLEENFPYYRCLSPADRGELERHILVFLSEKYFEGCAGLRMTDEIRVTIAAQACQLLLHRETDYYPGLRSILVYPSGYFAPAKVAGPGGVVTEMIQGRLGESWHTPGAGGPVVLSWEDVKRGAADPGDGRNVVFHEFAHQLDGESGSVEGAPLLDRRSSYIAWARVLGREYRALIDDLRQQRPTLLNGYGAQSPAEFFAVVTEAFFEMPVPLKARHPELYDQLAGFFRQDPAALWSRRCGGTGRDLSSDAGHPAATGSD
jgi:Mlc titration factor MtfA (ptsG expression regulator)